MNKRLKSGSFLIAGLFILLFSCSKNSSDPGPGEDPDAFDKTAMLTNYADNIIIPAYQHLQEDLDALTIAVNAFTDAPSIATQDAVRASYTHAYLSYENIEVFNFGPQVQHCLTTTLIFLVDSITVLPKMVFLPVIR
jgi:predicted lipoprotein